MSVLNKVKIAKEAKRSKATVNVGGGFTLPSGIYTGIINYMYGVERDDGSVAINTEITFPEHNSTKKEFTLYITDEEGSTVNDKGVELKDFSLFRDLVESSTGINIMEEDLTTEPKNLEVYDFDAKARVEKEIECFDQMEKQTVSIAVLHNIKNKNVLNETTNKWEATPEKSENNIIKFVFFEGGFIREEVVAEAKEPEFREKWLKEWENKSNDTYKAVKEKATAKEKTVKKSIGGSTSSKPKAGSTKRLAL